MKLKKIKNYFKLVIYLFKIADESNISIKWPIIVLALLKSIEPFPMIIFPGIIIDKLVKGSNNSEVIAVVSGMVTIIATINVLEKIFLRKSNLMQSKLKNILHEKISASVMSMKYEAIENDKFMQKVERAKVAVNGDLSWSVLRGLTGPRGVDAICMGFVNILVGIVQILSYLYILSDLNIGIIAVIILAVAINSILATKKKRIDFMQREKTSEISTKMNTCHMAMDDVGMAKDIRIFDMNHFLTNKYQENREEYFKLRGKFFISYFGIEESALFVSAIQNIVIYAYLAVAVIQKKFTIGYFSRYFTTITSFVKSLSMIIESCVNIDLFGEYMEDYYEIAEGTHENSSKNELTSVSAFVHTIQFEGVWFCYPQTDCYVLKDINLSISSGTKLLLVGLNGAGKSTLVKLLLRLYSPTKGYILIDGIDINEIRMEVYISLFSAIFQDYRIYAETFFENIAFDNKDIKRMKEVIEKLNIDSILKSGDISYESNMTKDFEPDGIELSQGQKQKVVLARALFKRSQVLVLDEPTSALDAYSEYEIYNEFDKITDGRTVIYISHRLSAAKFCDKIVVIKGGEIVEEGTHTELMQDRADYYEMYSKQANNYK